MATSTVNTRSQLRAIAAIATKDISDAIRNKTVLAIILGVATLVFSSQALPLLTRQNEVQRLIVYATDREIMRELRRLEDLQVSIANSPAAVITSISGVSAPVLGIELPGELPGGNGALELAAYHTHWLSDSEVAQAQAETEQVLSQLWGRPVRLQLVVTYPGASTGGYARVVEFTFVSALVTICAALVPLLFMEEKESHTLEMLRVAPVPTWGLLAGKAAAGLVYGLAAAAVILGLNTALVLHWPIAVLAALIGSLFSVALGLLLGAHFENQGTLNVVAGILLIAMLLPAFLTDFLKDDWPGWAVTILEWLPTTLLGNLLEASMVEPAPLAETAVFSCALLLMTALLCLPTVRRVQRLDA